MAVYLTLANIGTTIPNVKDNQKTPLSFCITTALQCSYIYYNQTCVSVHHCATGTLFQLLEVISLWHHISVPESPQSSEMHTLSCLITSVIQKTCLASELKQQFLHSLALHSTHLFPVITEYFIFISGAGICQ